MRTNGVEPKRKGPWKPQHTAKTVLAIDPGRNFAACGWNGYLNQVIIAQGTTHKSDIPIVHRMDMVREVVEDALRLFTLYRGVEITALEYPIPFYRASRESIAAVNLHAGVWAGLCEDTDIQMFSPGNSKNLPVWNHKGEGVAEAEAWLAAHTYKNLHPDSLDNALDCDVKSLCIEFPKFLDCAKVRLTGDAKSAVGIWLACLRYNNIKPPVNPAVFYVQL